MSPFDDLLDDLPGLLERLYDAALDPHKWPDFLSALPQSLRMTCDHVGLPLFNDQHASVQAKCSKKSARQLAVLTPHLMRAAEINRAISGARRSNLILDALGRAAFVLDRHGKVLDTNTHAQALMRGEDCPVHVDHLRVLHADRCEDKRALSAKVTAIASATERAMLPLRLASNRTEAPYLAWLIPIPSTKNGAPDHRQSPVENFGNDLTILMLVAPAKRSVEIPPEAIQAAFGVSSAQARLASALVAGASLGDYAARTGVSRNTVRNQLIAVFDRMGTRRLAELVATIVDALGPVAGRANGQAQPPRQVSDGNGGIDTQTIAGDTVVEGAGGGTDLVGTTSRTPPAIPTG